MVRLELVPQGKLAEAEVLIKCPHVNHFKYPLADVCIEVGVRGLQHVWQLLGDYQCQQSYVRTTPDVL